MLPTSTTEDSRVPDPSSSFEKPGHRRAHSSRDYYTLTNSASFESLLFHPVPSPSLRLEEMFDLWPTTPQPSHNTQTYYRQNDKYPNSRYLHDRDSISTLVDFGNWISQQSHSRSPSLLPPTPEYLRQNIFTFKSDSVECPLSSNTPALHLSHQPEEQETTLLQRGAQPDQQETPCLESQHSSFSSSRHRGNSTRTITPVPSLTYSQHSTGSSLIPGGDSPGNRVSTFSSTTQEFSPPNRRESMNHLTPEHVNHRVGSTQRTHNPWWDATEIENMQFYRDEILAREFAKANPHFAEPQSRSSLSQVQPCWGNQVSAFDWDDDDDEDEDDGKLSHRIGLRLARMKKSITDLRAAEKFIADAAARGKISFKSVRFIDQVDTALTPALALPSDKASRPAHHRGATDNIVLSHRQKKQQNGQRSVVARAVSADKLFKKTDVMAAPEDPNSSTPTSLSLPSRLGSVRNLAPARLKTQSGDKATSEPHNMHPQRQQEYPSSQTQKPTATATTPSLLPSPTLSFNAPVPQQQSQDMSPRRHRRGRTVSSSLEGFPPLPIKRPSTSPSHTHPAGDQSELTATPPTRSSLSSPTTTKPIKKRKRFSTFAFLSGSKMVVEMESTSAAAVLASRGSHGNGDGTNNKRQKFGHGVTRWVRRVFGNSGTCGRGEGNGNSKGKGRAP